MCSSQLAAQDLGGPRSFHPSDAEAAWLNRKAVLPRDSSSTRFIHQLVPKLPASWMELFRQREGKQVKEEHPRWEPGMQGGYYCPNLQIGLADLREPCVA